ncbi:hypothetical protein ABK040_001693 [Willaertia magna]
MLSARAFIFAVLFGILLTSSFFVVVKSSVCPSGSSSALYASGNSQLGRLGVDIVELNYVPRLIDTIVDHADIKQLVTSNSHSILLTKKGELLGLGENAFGQLGDTKEATVLYPPTKIDIGTQFNISSVYTSKYFTLFTTNENHLYAFGYGKYFNTSSVDQIITKPVLLDNSGWKNSTIKKVVVGDGHALILTQEGKLYGVGLNENGQLGIGTKVNSPAIKLVDTSSLGGRNISDVFAGAYYSLILTTDGSLFSMGLNQNGQLGDKSFVDKVLPTPINLNGKNITKISAGRSHVLLLTSNNEVYGFGSNTNGEINPNIMITNYTEPTRIDISNRNISNIFAGSHTSFFLGLNGTLYAVGLNNFGQLGVGSPSDTITQITEIYKSGELKDKSICDVIATYDFIYIKTCDDKYFSFGFNRYGNLGITKLSKPLKTLVNVNINAISTRDRTLFAGSDGIVYGFGRNDFGQLGDGTTSSPKFNPFNTRFPFEKSIQQIATGLYHTLVLATDGSVYSFGSNVYGELGINSFSNMTAIPTMINTNTLSANSTTKKVVQIAAGDYVSLLLTEDNLLYAFGNNQSGLLSANENSNNLMFSSNPFLINSNNSILHGKIIKQITTLSSQVTILTTNGEVYSWGINRYGTFCTGSNSSVVNPIPQKANLIFEGMTLNITQVELGSKQLLLLDGSGRVYTCGANNTNLMLLPTNIPMNQQVQQIAIQGESIFILTNNRDLYGLGMNNFAQLGDGSFSYKDIPSFIDSNIDFVIPGSEHTLFVKCSGGKTALTIGQIVMSSVFVAAIALVGAGLIFNRNDPMVKYRLIAPYVGMLALFVDNIFSGIITSAIFSKPDLFSVSNDLSPSSIMNNVAGIITSIMSIISVAAYSIECTRYILLRYLYEMVHLNPSYEKKIGRIRSDRYYLIATTVVFGCISAYFVLFNLLRRYEVIDQPTFTQINSITNFVIIIIVSTIVFIIYSFDLYLNLKYRQYSNEINDQLGTNSLQYKNPVNNFLKVNDPLFFRTEAFIFISGIMSFIISYATGFRVLALNVSNQATSNNLGTQATDTGNSGTNGSTSSSDYMSNLQNSTFAFDIIKMFGWINSFGGIAIILSVLTQIKNSDFVKKFTAKKEEEENNNNVNNTNNTNNNNTNNNNANNTTSNVQNNGKMVDVTNLTGDKKKEALKNNLLISLPNPTFKIIFKQYSKLEFSLENLYALDELFELKPLISQPEILKEKLTLFNQKYLEINGNLELKLTKELKDSLQNYLNSNTGDITTILQNVENYLLQNLTECYERFTLTKEYPKFAPSLSFQLQEPPKELKEV